MQFENKDFKILIIDDEPVMLKALEKVLRSEGFTVFTLDNGIEAVSVIEEKGVDVVLLDIMMPHVSGMDVLKEIKSKKPEVEVIMMTAYATIDTAVTAIKIGAYDYLTKPFANIDYVALVTKKALERKRLIDKNRQLESQLEAISSYQDIIGKSPKMREIFQLIESISRSSATVLIQGENGTGKELIARAIHYRSPRKERAFITINCAALSENLLESELFGHAKGSFTGAISNKKGLFEVAHEGTMFLDEIGEIPQAMQVKLLRVLQEGEIKRVGSNENSFVDVRIIAATNVDIGKLRKEGRFREDLFYRLNVIEVKLPTLRERSEDIPLLAYHFLKKYNTKMGKNITKISPDVLDIYAGYKWVGNVRELENVMERAVILAKGAEITVTDLPASLLSTPNVSHDEIKNYAAMTYKNAKKLAVSSFEKKYLQILLLKSEGNISQAAKSAGIDRSNFRKIVKKYDLKFNDEPTNE